MQVSQTSYMYKRVSLIWASKNPTLHVKAHKIINLMAPKSDPKVVLTMTYLGQSQHPAYHCILFRPTLLQLAILGPRQNHPIPSIVHPQWHFTSSCFLPYIVLQRAWTGCLEVLKCHVHELQIWSYLSTQVIFHSAKLITLWHQRSTLGYL